MNKKPSSSTKAQAVTIDFITGFLIITIALIIAINFIINMQEPSTFETVKRQAYATSDLLMSEGYPAHWNETSLIRLGLLSNNKLNLTKLEQAGNLSYPDLKTSLNNMGNIYWYITNKTTILNLSACGYGDPSITVDSLTCEPNMPQSKNLLVTNRFVTYNNTILRIVIIAWD
jgi:hypothetical protein